MSMALFIISVALAILGFGSQWFRIKSTKQWFRIKSTEPLAKLQFDVEREAHGL